MKTRWIVTFLCTAGLTAGIMNAQGPRNRPFPPGGPGQRAGAGALQGPGALMGYGAAAEKRLTGFLNLNADQQNRLHTAFAEAQLDTKGLSDQAQTLRQQYAAAIKAGDTAQIDQASQQLATIHQKQLAAMGKTMAKVYGMLSSEQKTAFDRRMGRSLGLRPAPPAAPGSGGQQKF